MNVANKNRQLVMVWVVGANQAGGLVLTVQTPTGVVLAPGLDFALDSNSPHHLPFGTCGPATCRANLVLDGAIMDEMRKAGKATASYTLTGGRKVSYSVPISGSDKMLADLLPAASTTAATQPAAASKTGK